MQRTRLRTALLLVVAVAVGGLGYLVRRAVVARRVDLARELGADFLPQVAQRIQNFRRVKVEKGRTVWQITARDAQYFEERGEIVVSGPEIVFFLDGQREAHVAGKTGRIAVSGRDVKTLELSGDVVVRLDDLEVRTDEATYDRARDLITSSSPVTITNKTLEVRGRGMEVEVGPQHVRLLDDVHTVVRAHVATS